MAYRYLIPVGLAVICAALWLWEPARWVLWIAIPALLVALFDFVQAPHTLRRNYPLFGHARYALESLRPFTRSYFVEGDLAGRPFNHEERSLVYARAKGQLDKHPMGTERDVYSDEYDWVSHSMQPNEAASEYWRCPIGEGSCSQPYESALLNISAMSFGSLSGRAIAALNMGAEMGGFAHNTGEGGISRYHTAHKGDLIWELGSGYFGARREDGNFDLDQFSETAANPQVKMIEIKLSQGAKPGHGGVLPGAKVTPEIAEARGVEIGKDVVSPAAHPAFSTPIELMEWLAQLRELSGGKPVGIKFCVGQPHELMALAKAMIATGQTPDYIVVDGAEGGTGAAPLELSNSVGMPLREGLIMTRNMLVGAGLKDKVKLAASGKIHSGAGMAVAFALGADFCNAARAFMFSLGCIQSMHCHTGNCPTGVATQKAWRQQGLIVEDKGPRVARFQQQTVESLRDIVVAMGLDDPWSIEPRDLRERVNGARSDAIVKLYEFLEPGELLERPESTTYAPHWAAARADSFRRAS